MLVFLPRNRFRLETKKAKLGNFGLLRLAPEEIFDAKPVEVPSLGAANAITQQALW